MLKNEEDLRGKLLIPFLNDLGFDISEISFETSFSIRLGKHERPIRGRSDILCKRNGKNLFIIELKNDSISITKEDIDQGISYARLLPDNIAPFTIISNGKITKIFDSITRQELTGTEISKQSDFWQNDCTLSTDEDLKIRYLALKNFVSFSPENLKQFCEDQVRDRMGPIIGNIDTPSSKFVKELYVQRKELKCAFDDFISSESSFFGLVGSAGVGKTSAMCSLALQSLDDKIVFFYNATIINKSPLEHIAQDLNGVFSSKSESNVILKKLDELGRFLNKSVLIFIDAIDESVDSNITLELSEIALAVRNLNKVKICISCKSNIWKNFLKINDTYTHLYEELKKSHDVIGSLDNFPGFLLDDFSNEEIKSIIPLYKSSFDFKGQISDSLLNELRNGFFLRIFSEVYSHKQIPQKIDDKELIKTYIKQSLEKTNIGAQSGLRILSKIGQILINHKYNSWETYKDEGLEVDKLLDKLDFSIDENLPEDLFARNILIKSNKEDSYNISFYYSKIRDYIICFHSYKLHKLSDNEFHNVLDDFYQNHIGQSAIAFYTENATTSHQSTLIKFKKDKSLKYVIGYDSYLNNNFKSFKNKFIPKTEGDIGIVLPIDLLKEDGYALFPLDSNSSNRILYENLKDAFSEGYYESRMFQIGVDTLYGSNTSLLIPDQNKLIKNNIFKQLKEIINKGKLTAYNSDILLMEMVSTILYYYYNKFGYDFNLKDFNLPRFDLIYPIDLKNLRYRIYKFRATDYYQNKKVDSNLINELVEKAYIENLDIPKLNVSGDFPPVEELFKIVNILLKKGYNEIQKHHLPYPDKSIIEAREFYEQDIKQNFRQIRSAQYSSEQAKLYIEKFFEHLESCYKEFVECYFPTFKDEFPFYKALPNEYFFYMKDSDILKWGMFGYRTSKCGKMKVYFKEHIPHNEAFEEDEVVILRAFSLDNILYNDHYNLIKTIDKINTGHANLAITES
ncbi:type I restriction enzyme HsdR N-terminal domain-containing protein [Flavobacterium gawalongense]|uniref:NTPase (NACHT family) n=1 Tax=Flavobacterium gawalongense TaxID=2594432 RepID=A0A553BC58_9FLAO|nr:type I restriction enzyme HsdR N-terminal domain-containing protein [Flavobacterium gawalongense]TRX05830.1 NTPase (NACHT family) [Flavobacterium gawalongense]TRX06759.1 NTPase (NACHT family) [Flavobacterium gawalongense]TRX22494.1 NTPase (NACHT family) [Flavobacterium gawalongense]